ncbi:hypothetical protein [Sphingobium yanoikuyae]|uniref:hypothetical protein n=1 Tax=Sphingobium yanoikuyae TaxID=13690 RepID=UPI0028B213AE|nr:hypothetical protein [Sphingobium yanoikuyae]
MNDLALSRRAVTRALFLLPAAAVPAAAVAAPAFVCAPLAASAWDDAMAQFEAAQAVENAYDAHDRPVWTPANEREMTRLIDVRCDAEDRLIATPASDMPAVIWKIEYARKRWVDFTDWPDNWWGFVMADLRRLAGEVTA